MPNVVTPIILLWLGLHRSAVSEFNWVCYLQWYQAWGFFSWIWFRQVRDFAMHVRQWAFLSFVAWMQSVHAKHVKFTFETFFSHGWREIQVVLTTKTVDALLVCQWEFFWRKGNFARQFDFFRNNCWRTRWQCLLCSRSFICHSWSTIQAVSVDFLRVFRTKPAWLHVWIMHACIAQFHKHPVHIASRLRKWVFSYFWWTKALQNHKEKPDKHHFSQFLLALVPHPQRISHKLQR